MKHHVVGNHVMGIHVKWGTAVDVFVRSKQKQEMWFGFVTL